MIPFFGMWTLGLRMYAALVHLPTKLVKGGPDSNLDLTSSTPPLFFVQEKTTEQRWSWREKENTCNRCADEQRPFCFT